MRKMFAKYKRSNETYVNFAQHFISVMRFGEVGLLYDFERQTFFRFDILDQIDVAEAALAEKSLEVVAVLLIVDYTLSRQYRLGTSADVA